MISDELRVTFNATIPKPLVSHAQLAHSGTRTSAITVPVHAMAAVELFQQNAMAEMDVLRYLPLPLLPLPHLPQHKLTINMNALIVTLLRVNNVPVVRL